MGISFGKWPKGVVFQFLQVFAFLGYLLHLFFLEEALRKSLADRQDQIFGRLIEGYLDQTQWFFLPDGFWRLFIPLLFVTLALLLFSSKRWWFLTFAAYFCCFVLMADRIYYIFFDSVIPLSSVEASGQLWKVRSSILSSLGLGDFFVLLSLLWIPLFGWFFHSQNKQSKKNRTDFIFEKFLGIVFFAFSLHAASQAFFLQTKHVVVENQHSIKVLSDRDQLQRMNFTVPYQSSYRSFAAIFGVFNFHIYNLYESAFEVFNKKSLKPEELENVAQFLKERQALNEKVSAVHGLANGKNVVVISLESFSSALVDLRINGQEVTPNLNQLAKTHFYWPKIIDNARTGGTSDAEFSVLTGLLPDLRRMAAMGIAERNKLRSLPLSLKANGYKTYSFHGNEASFWNRNINHPRLGIDNLMFEDIYDKAETFGLGVPDHIVFPKALEVLNNAEKPFFGFVISLTSHHPFPKIPDSYHDLELGDLQDGPFRRYLELANYTDRALGDFIESTKKSGIWKDLVLVLYGDHRPPFSESDLALFERICGLPLGRGRELQIPVFITLPGYEGDFDEEKRNALDTVGGLQDIYPTVLHLLGIEIPLGPYGVHLFARNSDRGAFPLYKLPGSYVFNGVVYSGELGHPIDDNLGVLFVNSREMVTEDPAVKAENFKSVVRALEMHMLLFNQNAQKLAIKLETQKENK